MQYGHCLPGWPGAPPGASVRLAGLPRAGALRSTRGCPWPPAWCSPAELCTPASSPAPGCCTCLWACWHMPRNSAHWWAPAGGQNTGLQSRDLGCWERGSRSTGCGILTLEPGEGWGDPCGGRSSGRVRGECVVGWLFTQLAEWVWPLICVCVPGPFSCVPLFETPWTVAHQAPLSMGFSRQE